MKVVVNKETRSTGGKEKLEKKDRVRRGCETEVKRVAAGIREVSRLLAWK